jgi:hypothetical protein
MHHNRTSSAARRLRYAAVALALATSLLACDDDGGTSVGDTVAAVVVSDQTLASPSAVVVKSVDTPTDGWIAIHEDTGAGSFGGVIGFAAVSAGMNDDVAVTLDRDALNGETLYAMLHIEGGEIGVYEFPGPDVPATTATGEVVAPAFEVLGGGVELVAVQ